LVSLTATNSYPLKQPGVMMLVALIQGNPPVRLR